MAQHGIIGDNYGIDLPQVEPDKTYLDEEKAMARFSKSKEFKKIKEIMQARIEFYQQALPDGRPVTEVDAQERANMWVIANAVIGEFNMILNAYETANEAVKDGRS
jgi:hypothetical protein